MSLVDGSRVEIRLGRFGVTVATNLGMRTNAFGAKSEAVAWLLTQPDQIQTQSSES